MEFDFSILKLARLSLCLLQDKIVGLQITIESGLMDFHLKWTELLSEKKIAFEWTCNVETKWGHVIHGVKMSSPDILGQLEKALVLVAVSGPADQMDLEKYLNSQGLKKGSSYLMFC